MTLPLARAAALPLLFLLLAAPLLCAAQGPISQPPAPGAPTASPRLDHPDSAPADVEDGGGNSVSPSAAPAPAPADDGEKAASPPAPIDPAPAEAPAPLHSSAATPAHAPAPSPAADDEGYKKKTTTASPAPAPAPAAMEVKSGTGASDGVPFDEAESERREGMSGGKKAGVVVGVFSAVAVVGLAAVVYRKRQANIRRSRYADYSARLELV